MRTAPLTLVLIGLTLTVAPASGQVAAPTPRPPAIDPTAGPVPPPAAETPEEKPKAKAVDRPKSEGPVGPAGAKAPTPGTTERVVKLWERASAGIESLDVAFTRVDKPGDGGKSVEYRGHAYLRKPDLACLKLERVDRSDNDRGPIVADHLRIIADGVRVRRYDYPARRIETAAIDRRAAGRTVQQGPLPFLFDVRAAEVRARYEVAVVHEDGPSWLVRVVPRFDDDRPAFARAWVWLDKSTALPSRVLLVAAGKGGTEDYKLAEVRVDAPIEPRFFVASDIEGWSIGRDPTAASPPAVAGPAGTDRRKQ